MQDILINTADKRKLAIAYLSAKEYVIKEGYANEIDWQYSCSYKNISESTFLREAAWVILSCGMKEQIIRSKFNELSKVFHNWQFAQIIIYDTYCREKALKIFNHPGKIDAILYMAKFISENGFEHLRTRLKLDGPEFLLRFPYLGPATSLHLAKNLGLNVSKPDRHMRRIAENLGFENVDELCEAISDQTDETIPVIDIVLWRYANLNKNYLELFEAISVP